MISPGDTFYLRLPYKLYTKDRIRFNSKTGGVYQPSSYRVNQQCLRTCLRKEWLDRGIINYPIEITLYICGNSRGDLDNTSGALLDAMHSIIIHDDNKLWVPKLSVEWHPANDEDSSWLVRIHVLPLNVVNNRVTNVGWEHFNRAFSK